MLNGNGMQFNSVYQNSKAHTFLKTYVILQLQMFRLKISVKNEPQKWFVQDTFNMWLFLLFLTENWNSAISFGSSWENMLGGEQIDAKN